MKVKARSGLLPCSFNELYPYSLPFSLNAIEKGVDRLDCSFSTIISFFPGLIIEAYLYLTLISSDPKSIPIIAPYAKIAKKTNLSIRVKLLEIEKWTHVNETKSLKTE